MAVLAWMGTAQADSAQTAAAKRDAAIDRSVEAKRILTIHKYADLGQRRLAQKQYEPAAEALATAYVLDPRPQLLFEVAEAFRRAECWVEALAVYQHLLEVEPQAPQRADVEAQIAQMEARLQDADFQTVQHLREYDFLGRRLAQGGQYAQAIEIYAALYAMRPFPIFLFNVAQGFRRSGRAEEALFLYGRFLRQDPQTGQKKETQGYITDLRNLIYKPPLYKRAWFWGVLAAGAVAVGTGIGLAVALQPKGLGTPGGTYVLTFSLRH